jgi:drug/metabolite transporter (DMT)-like permease
MKRETFGLLLGLLGVVIFGATLPMTRISVLPSLGAGLDPWFVTAGRAAVAGIVALVVLAVLRRRLPPRETWWPLVGASVLLVGGFPAFTGFAMMSVPAAHGSIVLGALPLATAAFGVIVTGDRPRPLFWLFAILGAVIVMAFALRDGGGRVELGDVLLIFAILSAALGYVLSARAARAMSGWEVISWALVIALPITLPLAWMSAPHVPMQVAPVTWMAFLYLALMSQYIGFFAWNAGLALGGVARVSQVQLLQTFFTLGWAGLIAGERVDGITWLAALIVMGVVLAGRYVSQPSSVQPRSSQPKL